jgi:hypothetical protein
MWIVEPKVRHRRRVNDICWQASVQELLVLDGKKREIIDCLLFYWLSVRYGGYPACPKQRQCWFPAISWLVIRPNQLSRHTYYIQTLNCSKTRTMMQLHFTAYRCYKVPCDAKCHTRRRREKRHAEILSYLFVSPSPISII